MRINRWLWGLWLAMILSMLMRQKADTYMVVALIILPILIVLLDLHEEIATLKEENKHQRKFVMDRYNVMQERLADVSNQIEKRLVVDFAEFARNNPSADETGAQQLPRHSERHHPVRKLKKRRRPVEATTIDLTQAPPASEPAKNPENKTS